MPSPAPIAPETDPRFPSGPWTGFFLQPLIPGRHLMDLRMNFSQGQITGEGRDWVGPFVIRGSYDLADGRCRWHKRYVGKHDVYYQGFNEGKGIWGVWEIPTTWRGGFHIWPEGMADPTDRHLAAEVEPPLYVDNLQEVEELVPVGAEEGPQA